jgi:sulfite exporter TauE/SafE
MKSNVGNLDRILRIIAGIVIIGLGLLYQSWWGVVGIIPLATGFIRWCPAYSIFHISSCGSGSCDVGDKSGHAA